MKDKFPETYNETHEYLVRAFSHIKNNMSVLSYIYNREANSRHDSYYDTANILLSARLTLITEHNIEEEKKYNRRLELLRGAKNNWLPDNTIYN